MSQIVRRTITAVGAGSSVQNDLSGTDIQLVGPCLLSMWASQSAADITFSVSNGPNNTIAADANPNLESAAGVVDKMRDQIFEGVLLPQGANLKLSISNTGGVSENLNYLLVAELLPG